MRGRDGRELIRGEPVRNVVTGEIRRLGIVNNQGQVFVVRAPNDPAPTPDQQYMGPWPIAHVERWDGHRRPEGKDPSARPEDVAKTLEASAAPTRAERLRDRALENRKAKDLATAQLATLQRCAGCGRLIVGKAVVDVEGRPRHAVCV